MRLLSQSVSTCNGSDGPFTVVRLRGEGPVASDDPRLRGIFKANAVVLTNAAGEGVSRDDWEIVDPVTRRRKAAGTAFGVHNGSEPIKALSIGHLADGGRFFANARVTLPPPGVEQPIVVEYGGAGGPEADRAVIVGGDCPRGL